MNLKPSLSDYEVAWLNNPRLNMFITVTLKQVLHFPDGISCLTEDRAIDLARLLKNRTSNAIDRKSKRNGSLPFVTYIHGGTDKRWHFHILTHRPSTMPVTEFEERFKGASLKIDWVYEHFDFCEIGPTDADRIAVLKYCRDGSARSGEKAGTLCKETPAASPVRHVEFDSSFTWRPAKLHNTISTDIRILALGGTSI